MVEGEAGLLGPAVDRQLGRRVDLVAQLVEQGHDPPALLGGVVGGQAVVQVAGDIQVEVGLGIG